MVTNKTVGKDLMPTDGQWNTLEHIEECLRTMAKFQEMIMGDKYFTWSLVVISIARFEQHAKD